MITILAMRISKYDLKTPKFKMGIEGLGNEIIFNMTFFTKFFKKIMSLFVPRIRILMFRKLLQVIC